MWFAINRLLSRESLWPFNRRQKPWFRIRFRIHCFLNIFFLFLFCFSIMSIYSPSEYWLAVSTIYLLNVRTNKLVVKYRTDIKQLIFRYINKCVVQFRDIYIKVCAYRENTFLANPSDCAVRVVSLISIGLQRFSAVY